MWILMEREMTMRKIEDVLTGLMIIGADFIVFGIVAVGAFFMFRSSNFTSLALIYAICFLVLHTVRNIYIALNLIFHGRYQDEMTVLERRQ